MHPRPCPLSYSRDLRSSVPGRGCPWSQPKNITIDNNIVASQGRREEGAPWQRGSTVACAASSSAWPLTKTWDSSVRVSFFRIHVCTCCWWLLSSVLLLFCCCCCSHIDPSPRPLLILPTTRQHHHLSPAGSSSIWAVATVVVVVVLVVEDGGGDRGFVRGVLSYSIGPPTRNSYLEWASNSTFFWRPGYFLISRYLSTESIEARFPYMNFS